MPFPVWEHLQGGGGGAVILVARGNTDQEWAEEQTCGEGRAGGDV